MDRLLTAYQEDLVSLEQSSYASGCRCCVNASRRYATS